MSLTEMQSGKLSTALVAARAGQKATDSFPGDVPATPKAAYAVQHAGIRERGHGLAGFKVGGVPPEFADAFPGGWLAGPVSDRQVYRVEDGGTVDVPAFDGGMAAYEAEFILTLSGLEALDGPVETLESARDFISAINIGAEIAGSPFRGTNALGPGAIIADFGVQGGVIVGPQVVLSEMGRLDASKVVVTIDADASFTAYPRLDAQGPFGALRFLLNHIQTLPDNIQVPDSLLLSSGAITGVHQSRTDTSATFDFGQYGRFTVRLFPHTQSTD